VKARKFIPLLVVAAGLLAYYNSFTGPFIFDDVSSIPQNPTIRHLWPIWQPLSPPVAVGITVDGRPLINLSLAVNYAFGGVKVWGYHALNLTIHILAGLTLLGIVRRTLQQPSLRERFGAAANGLALAVAVLWTVHPLQTESVTYVVQRTESLTGLFYLLTMYCFIRGAASSHPWRWYGWCVTACALGMACKEVMVSAPLMVMLYDRTFLSGSFREAWRPRRRLYLALAGTWILLAYLVTSTGGRHGSAGFGFKAITPFRYGLTQPGVITHYLRLAFWPRPLCLDYAWPIARTATDVWPGLIVVGALLAATIWAWRRKPALGFLGAWFFIILAPTSSFIPIADVAFEHRMYLPLAAVVTLIVMGIHTVLGRRSVEVFLAVAVALGVLTWRRNQDYRSDIAIWLDTVNKLPNNARAHENLGVALEDAGRLQEAVGHLEQVLRTHPDSANGHYNLGMTLVRLGRVEEGIAHYEQLLRRKPDDAEAHYNLGNALMRLGRAGEAIEHYEQALRIKPDYAEAHNYLAFALIQQGKAQEAIAHWEEALRIKPDYAEAHNNLAIALIQQGKPQEAIAHWEEALRIKPDYADAQINLARARTSQ
jgi:tetratricopeptide (TPR) repeat protein